jgi:hypothetical protein
MPKLGMRKPIADPPDYYNDTRAVWVSLTCFQRWHILQCKMHPKKSGGQFKPIPPPPDSYTGTLVEWTSLNRQQRRSAIKRALFKPQQTRSKPVSNKKRGGQFKPIPPPPDSYTGTLAEWTSLNRQQRRYAIERTSSKPPRAHSMPEPKPMSSKKKGGSSSHMPLPPTCPVEKSSASGSAALTDCQCLAGYTAASDGEDCTACGTSFKPQRAHSIPEPKPVSSKKKGGSSSHMPLPPDSYTGTLAKQTSKQEKKIKKEQYNKIWHAVNREQQNEKHRDQYAQKQQEFHEMFNHVY